MCDLAMLQGDWRIVDAESNGAPVPRADYEHVLITITGNLGIEIDGGQSMSVQFTLDPTVLPKTIDNTYLDGPQQGFTSLGIYELDQDTFRMCRTTQPGQARPSSFSSTPGSDLTLVVWNRSV